MSDFVSSVFTWQNLVGELAMLGVIRLFLWIIKKPLEWKRELAFWVVLPLFLLIVLGALNHTIKKEEEPRLIGNIDHIILHEPDKKKNIVGILLVASIKNTGMPSIAHEWNLSVAVPGGAPRSASPQYIPETIAVLLPNRKFMLYGEDALYNKALEKPIPKGGLVRGILRFFLEGMRRDTVAQPGTVFTLTFTDAIGKKHSTEFKWSGVEGDFQYFPGLRSPIIEKSKQP